MNTRSRIVLLTLAIFTITLVYACRETNQCPAEKLPTQVVISTPLCSIDTLIFESLFESTDANDQGTRFWDVYMVADNPDFETLSFEFFKTGTFQGTPINEPILGGIDVTQDVIDRFSTTTCNLETLSSAVITNNIYTHLAMYHCNFSPTNGRKKIGRIVIDDLNSPLGNTPIQQPGFTVSISTGTYTPSKPKDYEVVCEGTPIALPMPDEPNPYIPDFGIVRTSPANDDPYLFSHEVGDFLDYHNNSLNHLNDEYVDYAAYVVRFNPSIHFGTGGAFILSDEEVYQLPISSIIYECDLITSIEHSRMSMSPGNRYGLYFAYSNSHQIQRSNIIHFAP